MSWDRILQIDPGPGVPLRQRIEVLFAEQRCSWPMLCEGEAGLAKLQKKKLTDGNDWIIVQANPARRRSTHANTDVRSLAARPCFLCPQNMPTEERGIAFEDLVLLPNPFPVLPLHCTIADRQHRPQQLAGRIRTLLRLAREIGPDLAAFYNGPRSGASAPDHFHLQAASAAEIPILRQLPRIDGKCEVRMNFGRTLLVSVDANIDALQQTIDEALAALAKTKTNDTEPMFNLAVHYFTDKFTVIVFPRRKHRPSCYFAQVEEQIHVSPAVLEMLGILVTTDLEHFKRIDAPKARQIYDEVSAPIDDR